MVKKKEKKVSLKKVSSEQLLRELIVRCGNQVIRCENEIDSNQHMAEELLGTIEKLNKIVLE